MCCNTHNSFQIAGYGWPRYMYLRLCVCVCGRIRPLCLSLPFSNSFSFLPPPLPLLLTLILPSPLSFLLSSSSPFPSPYLLSIYFHSPSPLSLLPHLLLPLSTDILATQITGSKYTCIIIISLDTHPSSLPPSLLHFQYTLQCIYHTAHSLCCRAQHMHYPPACTSTTHLLIPPYRLNIIYHRTQFNS